MPAFSGALVVFTIASILAIGFALAMVVVKTPVRSVLSLVVTFFGLAIFSIQLAAPFIAVLQVFVYAGAILVLFLFVIMLLNLGHPSELADARGVWWKLAAGGVGLALLAQVFAVTRANVPAAFVLPERSLANQVARDGAIAPLAGPLFHEYLLAFEVTSVLLLAAIVGAVVLGKRKERTNAR